jgi:NitT/TauT family transport system ATP-binding protein
VPETTTDHRSISVEALGVSKAFRSRTGGVHAVDDVSLSIPPHQFVSLLGPSGCGKSTLLMMLAGLLAPSSGRIRIGDVDVNGPWTDLGIVFQRDVLLDWRSVLDNVLIQAQVRGMDKQAARERAMALLETVGLAAFAKRNPYELSGGMRQRVAICRALLPDAPLLLMDEPFAALDALTREQMGIDLLGIWERDRKTVIFVTHSIQEAVFLSDRVVVMSPRPGRIAADITIDIERPRRLADREAPEFLQHSHAIRDVFIHEGVLHEQTIGAGSS